MVKDDLTPKNELPDDTNGNQQQDPASPGQNNASAKKEKWLDKQEVLQMLHISERTLQRWRSDGLMPYSPIGRKHYYREEDVMQLLEKNFKRRN